MDDRVSGDGILPAALEQLLATYPTPLYVYDLDAVAARLDRLARCLGARFDISYAVKANPNRAVLAAIASRVQGFDVSSFAEAERVRATGSTLPISFTGPGKRDEELRRFAALGAGTVVLESLEEAEALSRILVREGLPPQPVLLRINPMRVPRHFGASMSGRSSQFGIDEEVLEDAIDALRSLPALDLTGFHCYSGTNCLHAEAVAENFGIMLGLFRRATARAGIRPKQLVFGAGFGIPYHAEETELDLDAVAAAVLPEVAALQAEPAFAATRCVLELGRWIVGPAGALLTTVLRGKSSRGAEIRICDAGFNANMAACGMLGGAFRRNWRIANLSNPGGPVRRYDLVGPLCTSIDRVASGIDLPEVRPGDVLAIVMAGAYGVTASPTRFISHPEPAEIVMEGGRARDVSESRLNRWADPLAAGSEAGVPA